MSDIYKKLLINRYKSKDIDLDDYYKELGYSTKIKLINLIKKTFKESDYTIEIKNQYTKNKSLIISFDNFIELCRINSTNNNAMKDIYNAYINDYNTNYDFKIEQIQTKESSLTQLAKNSLDVENDELMRLINNSLDVEEQQIFSTQFALYLRHGDDDSQYVIDLNDIWKLIGYSRKDHAITALQKYLKIDVDYKIMSDSARTQQYNNNQIVLNIKGFKKYCLKVNTEQSDKICEYYIKMEQIYNRYIKNTLNEHKLILETKNKEIEQLTSKPSFQKINTPQILYVMSSSDHGVYKIGCSSYPENRKRTLQTGNINDIKILYEFNTYNMKMLESITHEVLHKYRINREFFKCDLKYIISVINIIGNTIHTIKSSNDCATHSELLDRINSITNVIIPYQSKTSSSNNNNNSIIYLNVPYAEKDYVKRLGAKFNFSIKKWYITNENKHKEDILSKYSVCRPI